MAQTSSSQDRQIIREMILREFLSGEDPKNLSDDTALITNSVLDSLAILKLVGLLEERFKISIQPHESDVDHLNTIALIEAMVRAKKAEAKR